MKVTVRLFAAARQWAGADSIELDVQGSKVADVRAALFDRLPQLSTFGPQMRFAVDSDFADDATPVTTNTEIACIPPVSGG